MSFWSSVTSQISKLGTAKTRVFELVSLQLEGSGDTEEFVSLARSLIADASVLVDTATSADVAPGALEELAEACSTFSAKTVTFVHAARGNLFDPNSDTKTRFAEASSGLDCVLDSLLDVVLEFMAKYPQAKSVVKQQQPDAAEPVKAQPVAVAQDGEAKVQQAAEREPESEPVDLAVDEPQKAPPKRSARRPAPPPPSVPPLLSPISPRSVPSFSPAAIPRPESPRRRPTDLASSPRTSPKSSPRRRPSEPVSPSSSPPASPRLSAPSTRPHVNSMDADGEKRTRSPLPSLRKAKATSSPDVTSSPSKSPRFLHPIFATLNSSDKLKSLKIHRCAAAGDLEGVKQILAKSKKELNAKNGNGFTPLQISLQSNQEVIALLLIASGADVDTDDDLNHPLHLAVCGEMYGAGELMISRGTRIPGEPRPLIETALRNSPSEKGTAFVRTLLEKQENVHYQNKYGDSFLHLAASSGWLETVDDLLEAGVDKNSVNAFGETCLHKAARVGNADMVKKLLKHGVDEKVAGQSGVARDVAAASVKDLFSGQGSQPAAQIHEASPTKHDRGRALTLAVAALDEDGNHSEEDHFFRDLELLDKDVQRLAFRASVNVKAATTIERVGVFEPYTGAMFEIETGKAGVTEQVELQLNTEIEPFRSKFYGKHMLHFMTSSWGKGEVAVLSIVATPDRDKGTYSALLFSAQGEQPLDLNFHLGSDMSGKGFRKALETSFTPGKKWKEIADRDFSQRLLTLETKHSRNANCYRMAVVYGRADQKTEADMFTNRNAPPEFDEFLNILGDRIELRGWSGYSGGLNAEDAKQMPTTFYTLFNGLEIILHVSTMMTPEMQRRLIGNDIAMIFFQPPEAAFRCQMRGNVNSVAAVVAPSSDPEKYQMGVFRRGNIKQFDPPLPEDGLISRNHIRDFLLTKLVNGELAAHRSPPLSTMHTRVFKTALLHLVEGLEFAK